MLILGIESSCDDTSVALVDCSNQGHIVISEKTASQIDIHQKYGGVVPEIAGRAHAEKIVPLIEEVLANPPLPPPRGELRRPDVIAVTAGPGLITGLVVGVEAARTLACAWNIPLVAVNHIEGHIHSVEISDGVEFPALALVVSGGHTELVLMKDHGDYQMLGATKDDAAGECFDKIAKLLGLPYPGGPEISKLAETGDTKAINFPRPMLKDNNYNFSFAGLKTSALYWLRDNKLKNVNDFCASFEQAIVDVLVGKTLKAVEEYNPKSIILCGGVAANKKLRQSLVGAIHACPPLAGMPLLLPEIKYCMDNAAMIAVAGYYHALKKDFVDWKKIEPNPNWKIA